jgi:NAD(P)-dependent dehydrogenase (short-subunit alcohol dehydrogenase family)
MAQKIALITGGDRGLGRSMALHCADRDIDLILTYRANETAAAEVVSLIQAKGRRAAALRLNTSDIRSFDHAAAELKSILQKTWKSERFDFLVNNAGFGVHAPFTDTTEKQFDSLLNVHLKGVFFLTQKLLPLINDGGRIVNVSSGLARFSLPGYCAYAAMKGAVEVLTRYLAKELGPRGIAVNVVAPGAIETDFGGGVVRDNPEVNKFIASGTALGRVGLPEDIGGVVASLLSEDCRWINGQRIEVSGGVFL